MLALFGFATGFYFDLPPIYFAVGFVCLMIDY